MQTPREPFCQNQSPQLVFKKYHYFNFDTVPIPGKGWSNCEGIGIGIESSDCETSRKKW